MPVQSCCTLDTSGLGRRRRAVVNWDDLVEAADGGDAEAEYQMALRYENGDGVATNVKLAAKHCRKAAEAGHIEAQMMMAKFALLGKGIRQDHDEAMDWYQRAADQGHEPAKYNLEQMMAHRGGGTAERPVAKPKTFLLLNNEKPMQLPENFHGDDVRYTETLVEHFLEEYTRPGDIVLDPFMGFGTTLVVAERMGRVAYGIEYDAARCAYVRSLVKHPERAIHGDSRDLSALDLPTQIDFSITSPPYMGHHHKENPFTAYTTEGDGYRAYLDTLKNIYSQIKTRMPSNANLVVEVANLKHDDAPITTLAWDIGRELSTVLTFQGEVIVGWEPTYGFGYDHSYCLVFNNSAL